MKLEEIIKRGEDIPLSGNDIKRLLHDNINIYTYSQLPKMNDIREFFHPVTNSFILLYQTIGRYTGHWIAVMHHPETKRITHFDSYGFKPDQELLFSPYLMHTQSGIPYLSHLYNKLQRIHGYRIEHNPYPYQSNRDHINTCGRHAVLRIMLRDISQSEYRDALRHKTLSPDEIVTLLTLSGTNDFLKLVKNK